MTCQRSGASLVRIIVVAIAPGPLMNGIDNGTIEISSQHTHRNPEQDHATGDTECRQRDAEQLENDRINTRTAYPQTYRTKKRAPRGPRYYLCFSVV
jgi:hypothetical protein